MKLKEWADLQVIYKRSRKQPNKLIFKRENVRRLWPMWAAVGSTVFLVVFAMFGIKNPALIPYTYMALAPWALLLFFTRLTALRMVYPQQFADHAIDRQPSLERENALCYAFFLEALRDEGYTVAKLRDLSDYADLTGSPPRPALSQSLSFASLIALMVALSTEIIKATPLFTWGKGSVIVVLGMGVLFLNWLVLDGIRSVAYERLCMKRYVDMAVFDLEVLLQSTVDAPVAQGAPDASPPHSSSLHGCR
jgi:hypothetical protein